MADGLIRIMGKISASASVLLFIGLVAVAGCSKDSSPAGPGNGGNGGNGGYKGPKTWDILTSGTSFVPATLQIYAGDTVRWTSDGSHTVTSGTGSSDPNVGSRFDRTLNSGETFTWVIIKTGTYPYFCRTHESYGMKGTITVLAKPS